MFCVLLVEPDASFRQALSDVLRVYFPSIGVDEADDGAEAVNKVDYLRPNIIFINMELHGKNGLELVENIKRIYRDIEIVILATSNHPDCRQQAILDGADSYISKQDDSCMEEILRRIEDAMAG